MKINRWLLTLSMLTLAAGCGAPEPCDDGFVRQDGECVVSVTCGANTKLVDGACVLDMSGCTQDTELVDGVCVSTSRVCQEGTTFDSGTRTCLANYDILCGEDTIVQMGECVPTENVCGLGTTRNASGLCVLEDTACATGTALDVNTSQCVVTDMVCGPRTAFTDGQCVPTEEACESGTDFDDATQTCQPDVRCQNGDVILQGVCVPASEELAGRIDITEAENNDPGLGGTSTTLAVKALGELTVYEGVIGAPADLNGDLVVDQDVDVYSFTAEAGQAFTLSVHPGADAPLLGFRVSSVDGSWVRWSPMGLGGGSAREVLVPTSGEYRIAIAPVRHWRGESGTQGSTDARYIATLGRIDPPTPIPFDVTSGTLTGSLTGLSDNLFEWVGTNGTRSAFVEVLGLGAGVETGYVTIWSDASTRVSEIELRAGERRLVTLPSGNALALFDWGRVTSQDTDFEVRVTPLPYQDLGTVSPGGTTSSRPVGLRPGLTVSYTFSMVAGEVLELRQTSASSVPVAAELVNSAGEVVFSSSSFSQGDDAVPGVVYQYSPTPESYTLLLESADPALAINAQIITVQSITPTDLGARMDGDRLQFQDLRRLTPRLRRYYRITPTEPVRLEGRLTPGGSGDLRFLMFDAATGALLRSLTSPGAETLELNLRPTEHLMAVEAATTLGSGFVLDGTLSPATRFEAEPNDTLAQGTLLPQGVPYDGIADATDTDFYTIDLATPLGAEEVLLLEVDPGPLGALTTWSCTLRDIQGVVVAQTLGQEGRCVWFTGGLAAGPHSLEITTDAARLVGYEVVAQRAPFAPESESNDVISTATPWPGLPGGVIGELSMLGDVDIFRFTASRTYPALSGGLEGLRVELGTPELEGLRPGDFSLEVLDSSGMSMGSGSQTINLPLLAQGDYFVRVVRTDMDPARDGLYTIQLTEETFAQGQQGGDTCNVATPIVLSGTFQGSFTGASNDYSPSTSACTGFSQASGLDVVYSMNLSAGDTLNATLTGDNDTALYFVSDCNDVTASCLVGADVLGSPEDISYTAPSAQRVFIIVDMYSNTTGGDYTLTVNVTGP